MEVQAKVLNRETVSMVYTNYRGETATRFIRPIEIFFGSTEWHPERQWLLRAFDFEKQAERSFAMKEIRSWEPALENELAVSKT